MDGAVHAKLNISAHGWMGGMVDRRVRNKKETTTVVVQQPYNTRINTSSSNSSINSIIV